METSLIGKALDFGSSEYGFESRVSSIFYTYHLNYLFNHLLVNSNAKNLSFEILCTKKVLASVRLLKRIALVKNFYLFKNKNKIMIRVYVYFYKKIPVLKTFKFYSTPSRCFFVSQKALTLLTRRSGGSLYLLSTDKGLVTHLEALRLGLGGKLLLLITI